MPSRDDLPVHTVSVRWNAEGGEWPGAVRLPQGRAPANAVSPHATWIRRVIAAGAALIGAAMLLLEWRVGLYTVRTVLPGIVTVRANTALGLVAAGAGLFLLPDGVGRVAMRWRGSAAATCGAVALLLGLLTFAEYAAGLSLGLDELFVADPDATSPSYPGRVSPATAISLACVGTGILLLLRAARRPDLIGRRCAVSAHLLSMLPASVGYLSLVGYAYDVEQLFSFGPYVGVALHTAVALALLALATLLVQPDLGWRHAFSGRPVALGVLARLLPLSILLPFLAGAAVVRGARAHEYDPMYGAALFALAAAASSVGLAWLAVRAVRRAEGELTETMTALQVSEERLRVAQTAGNVGTFEWCPDRAVLHVSDEYRRIWGLAADTDVTAELLLSLIHPDDRGLTAVARMASPGANPLEYAEYRITRPDTGEQRWIARRGEIVPGDRGDVRRFLGVAFDVTERRRAAERLHASEERFRTLAGAMPALIFVTDENGSNTYTNTVFQQFTGRTAKELLGDGWLTTLHPDDRERAAATWAKAWQTGTNYATEYRIHRQADTHRWHVVRGTPVRDATGRITQWIGVCTDVQEVVDARNALAAVNAGLEARVAERTAELAAALARVREEARERAVAEAQVRQLQKMEAVGQLTGGIAHDFNNMLAIVTGSLDLAQRRLAVGDLERVRRSMENADEGARRAAQLTARLLAFSRQAPLDPQVLDANTLVGGMSELLRRTLGEDVRVETALAEGLWRIFADPGQLENALLNLCVNARDAMPGGGKLTIETANCILDENDARDHAEVEAGQYVLIAVSDTGTGMPPEVVEHAFDPFYTTKDTGKGTGLGLSQVYGFVKQSGGSVRIDSEPGQGTTVKVHLPRYLGADAGARSLRPTPGVLPRAQEGEVVLLVEDEAAVRRASGDLLSDLGYAVIQASDANQALALLVAQPRVDLLFTDVVMPGMSGRSLAEEALRLRPTLKVLYTTGYTRDATLHNGTLDPGVSLLPKPFTVERLAQKVRDALDGNEIDRRA